MRLRLAVTVVLLAAAAPPFARGQGGYAEPPPSPPVAKPVGPPVVAEPPTTTATPTSTATSAESPSEPPTPAAIPTAAAAGSPAATPIENPTATPTALPPDSPPATSPPPPPAYEPYSPPQMTWGTPARSVPAPVSQDPSPALTSFRGAEWGLGAIATEGGGMAEGALLADFGRFALGALMTAGGVNEHVGVGFHLAGGPRFPLSEGIRLDTLLDLGLVFFGHDGKSSGFFGGQSETSGSDEKLPAVGARAGLTFTSATSGWYLSIGAAVRHVARTTVTYTTTECPLFGACTTSRGTATYGGTIAGGYLTFGQGAGRRR